MGNDRFVNRFCIRFNARRYFMRMRYTGYIVPVHKMCSLLLNMEGQVVHKLYGVLYC